MMILTIPKSLGLQVVMDNGILAVTLSKPDGNVTGIKYSSIDNVLEVRDKEAHRG